jgi:hypothetical protein
MTPRSVWVETPPGRWDADAQALGVDYCLVAGEGVFRRGTAWSLVWDCPRCERRVHLASLWDHTDPCGDGCLCVGWQGRCACGVLVRIGLWGADAWAEADSR